MTIPRLRAINRYHTEHPPLALMVEAYLGFNKQKQSSADPGGLLTPDTQGPAQRG